MEKLFLGLLSCLFLFGGSAFGGYKYKIKVDHKCGNVTPSQAYAMVQKDPDHTVIKELSCMYSRHQSGLEE